MADYIDREHYCKNVCRCAGFEKGCNKDKCSLWKEPAADVAPVVHGRWGDWTYAPTDGVIYQRPCSECKWLCADYANYCPHCGAKMDKEENK